MTKLLKHIKFFLMKKIKEVQAKLRKNEPGKTKSLIKLEKNFGNPVIRVCRSAASERLARTAANRSYTAANRDKKSLSRQR